MLQYVNFKDTFFKEIKTNNNNVKLIKKIQSEQKLEKIKMRTNHKNNEIIPIEVKLSED